MKKRTKISLRTKIYLTMVGLLALTGAAYAATPLFFGSRDEATGIAVSPENMYETAWCNNNLYGYDCLGQPFILGQIPLGNQVCIEKYPAIVPKQCIPAGFTVKDVF